MKIEKKHVKTVVAGVSTIGAGIIVGYVIKHVTPEDVKPYKKYLAKAGAYGIGVVVGAAVKTAVEKEIDDLYESADELKQAWKEAKDESEPEQTPLFGMNPSASTTKGDQS